MPKEPPYERYDCQECGKNVGREYHPFLYCELVKLGHRDPEAYLREYGFVRAKQAIQAEGREGLSE